MKILNLYAGIGGNRKLWGDDHEITAVEYKEEIANIYKDNFPNDKIIIGDAHQYLLEHFEEFDFIWSSPPCPSHSKVRFVATRDKKTGKIRQTPIFPDMKLYEEILFLQYYFKGKYCVENVISYYDPLIAPQKIGSHYYWANFIITPFEQDECRKHDGTIKELEERKGFNLDKYTNIERRKLLRNCVEPEFGRHILECSLGLNKQKTLL